jgi:hypothetical protein
VLTFTEIRRFLRDIALAVSIITMIVFCLAVVSIATDMHAIRTNAIISEAQLRVGLFSRVDSLLWKMDSLTTIASAFNKNLSTQLTQVRVQVKQSSDDAADQSTRLAKATTSAMKDSLATTQQAIAAVVDQGPPVVHVAPTVPPPSVSAPPPLILTPIVPELAPPPPVTPKTDDKGGFWHWMKRSVWPFTHDPNAK